MRTELAVVYLLILSLAAATAARAGAPGTSQGPAPREEAAVLWQDGQQAYERGDQPECIRNLQRLVDRHVGSPGYLRAHLLLGLCYLRAEQPEKAVPPLKHYVEATSLTPDGTRARLALTRAEIERGRFNEALLLTTELLSKDVSGADRLEALVLKARALLGLDEDVRASQSIASFKKESETLGALSPLTEEASLVELQLKIRACNRLPEKAPASASDEGRIRSQFRVRGQCLQEAVLMLKSAVQTLSAADWLEKSLQQVVAAVEAHERWVESKLPEPKGKRRKEQKAAYEKELRTGLHQDLAEFVAKTKELLSDWKKAAPAAAAKYADPILRALP